MIFVFDELLCAIRNTVFVDPRNNSISSVPGAWYRRFNFRRFQNLGVSQYFENDRFQSDMFGDIQQYKSVFSKPTSLEWKTSLAGGSVRFPEGWAREVLRATTKGHQRPAHGASKASKSLLRRILVKQILSRYRAPSSDFAMFPQTILLQPPPQRVF